MATATTAQSSFRSTSQSGGKPDGKTSSKFAGKGGRQPVTLKTLAFDSVGNRKYALQIRKARNNNPCFKLVEGVPQDDGTYRKFSLTVWSEDFDAFFAAFDEIRDYIREKNIRTPANHKYDPNKPRKGKTSK